MNRIKMKAIWCFYILKTVEGFKDKFEIQRKIAFTVANLNKSLKQIGEDLKIDKKLTLHIARHTFGNISGDKISIQMLQKLYRHSSITTTIGYQSSFIHKDADDALDAVLGMWVPPTLIENLSKKLILAEIRWKWWKIECIYDTMWF